MFSGKICLLFFQRLKERVAQLDLENTALTEGAQRLPAHEDSISDIHELVNRILKLKAQLRFLNLQSEKPVNVEGTSIFISMITILSRTLFVL